MRTVNARPISKQYYSSPLTYAISITIAFFAFILMASLVLTQGNFSFTLDDPYIHLALAQHLLDGHYGINANEFSAPSSSILWPFLIAPLSALKQADFALWLLNIVFGLLSLSIFSRLIQQVNNIRHAGAFSHNVILVFLLLFVLLSNMIGLSFVGMEHQLQVLMSLLIFYGLFKHLQTQKTDWWLWIVIFIAPFIRYECLAISGGALFYLFFSGRKMSSILILAAIVGGLVLFSFFLLQLGLSFLPDSILIKSSPAQGLGKVFHNLWVNLHYPKSIALVLCAMLFLHTAWFRYIGKPQRLFYASLAVSILLHLFFGRTGWYFRYELYIWVYAGAGIFCLYAVPVLTKEKSLWKKISRAIMILFIFIGSIEHTAAIITTPMAASNIYHQQAQMSRFITDFYQKPVAVNDLGLVSFNNDEYVLDLWGLGSSQARQLRKAGGVKWMGDLTKAYQVDLAMIYQAPNWFPNVPPNWVKVAELSGSIPKIVSLHNICIFATNKSAEKGIRKLLKDFEKTLPTATHLHFEPN